MTELPLRDVPEGYCLSLRVEPQPFLWMRNDDSGLEYTRQIAFRLLRSKDDDEDEEPIVVGRVDATLFLAERAMNDRVDIIDAADSIDQETYEAAEALYNDRDGIVTCLQDQDAAIHSDALLLSTLWLEPELRGMELGPILLARVIDWCNPVHLAVVVMPVDPAAYFVELHQDDPYRERSQRPDAQARVEAWAMKLGFRPWPRSDLYYYPLERYHGELVAEDWITKLGESMDEERADS